ncbi:MAG: hypothetical protein R2911_43165 [Caldilineaceae bacterium]
MKFLMTAALACCGLGPTFGAIQPARVNALDTVLITGLGPVGLGGVINGVYRERVIGVESNPWRAQLALGWAYENTSSIQPLRARWRSIGANA